MTNKLVENIKLRPTYGRSVMSAGAESQLYVDGLTTPEIDKLLASIAGSGESVQAQRQQFASAVVEPIMQIIPYVELYSRFFMPVSYQYGEDNALPVEDNLVLVAYSSHPQTGVFYTKPGYQFTRPTFQTFTTGAKIPWNLMQVAGWNVLSRQMNYLAWEMAKKRDAAAKVVLDAAIPNTHKMTSTNGLVKTAVDNVIRGSNQIGFPVKIGVINPARLMEMQSWTWGGTGFFIPESVAMELVNNLYYGQYGGVQWFAHPNVPVNTVYFGGDPSQIGWHQMRGTPRNDSAVDITNGVDLYTLRDQEHSWYIQNTLSLWTISIN